VISVDNLPMAQLENFRLKVGGGHLAWAGVDAGDEFCGAKLLTAAGALMAVGFAASLLPAFRASSCSPGRLRCGQKTGRDGIRAAGKRKDANDAGPRTYIVDVRALNLFH
jgi:hypothetical protein